MTIYLRVFYLVPAEYLTFDADTVQVRLVCSLDLLLFLLSLQFLALKLPRFESHDL
jgi:hypothetical protein